MIRLALFLLTSLLAACATPTTEAIQDSTSKRLAIPGAARMDLYKEQLQGKKIGLCVNHTSIIDHTHLVDTLVNLGYNIQKIYTPEHGFRGKADAGELIANDTIGAIPVVSLYGKNKKPSQEQLSGINLMIFDMQDVGTRFYTYISTMHYVLEACAEAGVPVLILDRPNPNDFIDGPVLDTAFRSFVGMHPIPTVHGLTIGELAQMINRESWLADSLQCDLSVIPVANWQHGQPYQLPIAPSPNLPNQQAILWYPTLCFFEGTIVSIGRGTDFPFQVLGNPHFPDSIFTFTPQSGPGSKWPKHQDVKCYGWDLREKTSPRYIDLEIIQQWHAKLKEKEFFTNYFNTLAGTDQLQAMILEGQSAEEIRNSWQNELEAYQKMRKQYLLYKDDRY
jgi:uncharacterized protein YbbC (DUF1343 family)